MLASVFILCFSLAALLYWARYTCLSILQKNRNEEDAARVAEPNRLEFLRIRHALEAGDPPASYERMRDALGYDFLALTYLLRYAATVQVGKYTSEERLLIADFHLMRAVYRLSRAFSSRAARFALLEMSAILEHFAIVLKRRMSLLSSKILEA